MLDSELKMVSWLETASYPTWSKFYNLWIIRIESCSGFLPGRAKRQKISVKKVSSEIFFCFNQLFFFNEIIFDRYCGLLFFAFIILRQSQRLDERERERERERESVWVWNCVSKVPSISVSQHRSVYDSQVRVRVSASVCVREQWGWMQGP